VEIKILEEPLFAAAKGAALYARWRQEIPWGCWESDKCEEGRRKERGETGEQYLADNTARLELR